MAGSRRCRRCITWSARSTRWWRWTITCRAVRPRPKITKQAVTALLENRLPPKGSVIAPDIALCDECPAQADQAHERRLHRVQAAAPDADGPGEVLPGPGRGLHGAEHPQRLRSRLHRAAACRAPAASGPPRASATRASRSCPRSAPTWRRRKSLTSTRCSKASRIRSGTFYRYGLAKSMLRRKLNMPE